MDTVNSRTPITKTWDCSHSMSRLEIIPVLVMTSNPTSVKGCQATQWQGVPMTKIYVPLTGLIHNHGTPILNTPCETHLQPPGELIILNPPYKLQPQQRQTILLHSCISATITRRLRLLLSHRGPNTQTIIFQHLIHYTSNRRETNPINIRRLNMQVHRPGQCHSLHKLYLRTVHTHRRYHRK